MEYLVVCPLAFIAGFVDAVAGGGGLISLPAYLIAGLPVHTAIGTNKLSSGMGTAIAAWQFWKNGCIPWKQAAMCCIVALFASGLGANLGLLLDESIFRILLLFILPATAVYILFHKSFSSENADYPKTKTVLFSILTAFIVGVYDGFYGPGTGTFLILLLTGLAHMRLDTANGIAKSINLCTNLAGLAVLLINGKVMISLGFIAGIFSILGNYIGTRCFQRGGAKIVKPMIIFVIAIFFIKTLLEVL